MRVATWNVNGLRAALRKGFTESFAAIDADVLVMQEVRATLDQLPAGLVPDGWHAAWSPSSAPGYAGVAVWSRWPITVLDPGEDAPPTDGRVLRVETDGWQIVGLYLPSGSSGPDKQAAKEAWMAACRPWLDRLREDPRPTVVVGDLNIAHTPNDLHSWRRAADLSGFLPHERAWFGALLASGWDDVVRRLAGDRPGPWSWWSHRGRAKEEDRGWRIDYVLANAPASARLVDARIDREAGIRCSDHAPVIASFS